MAQFYADENFPLPTVEALRKLGHDILTIQEDGKSNQRYPDHAVLSAASKQGRAVLTTNRRHSSSFIHSQKTMRGLSLAPTTPTSSARRSALIQLLPRLRLCLGS